MNDSEDVDKIEKQINDQLDKNSVGNEIIKYEIKVNEIITQEIGCWLDKMEGTDNEIKKQLNIEGSYDADEIIEQLEDKINNSKGLTDLDEIKKQINRIKDSDHENEIIKNKIKYWLDEIKVTDQ
ncbi:25981_t:CDS:2, partial [Gigaspora margarita]